LTSAEVVQPAVRLAEAGYIISPFQERLLNEYKGQILRGNAARFIFGNVSTPPECGFLLRQPILANTLKRLGHAGFEDFYTGKIGHTILDDMKHNGGFITDEDFHTVPWPTERDPLKAAFNDWSIATMPPPGGGIVLIEMLHLFEELVQGNVNPDSPETALLFAHIIRKARRDRRRYNLGEYTRSGKKAPDLTSIEYAKITAMKLRLQMECTGETSHFNVIDRFGNIVAVTQSIERSYGAKVATQKLGFLYNGFIKGFKLKNKRHPHFLRPGAVARSNACPTIVFENSTPRYAIGSTGSERMISGIFQVLVRLRSQPEFAAVAAPRLHCTPEKELFLEAGRFTPETLKLLYKHAFTVIPYDEWAFSTGGLHLVGIDSGKYWGVADPRRDGGVLGPAYSHEC
jgi:gamma-glutamyltranspeptidase/glutathione hydrolase